MRWNNSLFKERPKKKGAHLALDDILESIEELRFYKKKFFHLKWFIILNYKDTFTRMFSTRIFRRNFVRFFSSTIKTDVAVVGAGAGGTAVSAQLKKQLSDKKISLIDGS